MQHSFTSRWLAATLLAACLSASALAQSPLYSRPLPWASNNGGTAGGILFFDLNVTTGVLINAFDCNLTGAVNTAVSLEVYTTPGTHVGNETNASLWSLQAVDIGGALAAGREQPTHFTLTAPLQLSPGSYGIGFRVIGSGQAYNGTGTGGTPTVVSNNEMTLTAGSAISALFTGSFFSIRAWNGAIYYVPASGLFPAFTGTPLSGPLNTMVQFTDQTYSSDPSGVLSWQWDFDGDSIVDSTLQNPSFVYGTEGVYNVSLTVIDATHGLQTLTKPSYIAIDTVEASFTGNVLFGSTVQFLDSSAGSPTTWAWDFNGDSVVDSTAQNPVYAFPAAGSYAVSLTVTDAISTDTTVVNFGVGIIPMPGFGSTYSSATSTRGVWFQTPVRFSIVSLKVPDESNHGLQNVAVYRLAAAPPIYSASATGGLEFLQIGTPSAQTIPCALSFDANEYIGIIAACGDASTMRTSYATPVGPFASSILGQPTTLTRFITQTNLVGTNGTGAYSQEVAAAIGRVDIGVSSCVGLAYGAGSPSGAGPAAPSLTTTALPFIGQTAQLTIDNHDTNALGLLAIGIGRTSIPTPLGTILVNNVGATLLVNGGVPLTPGQYNVSIPVPNNPALNGVGPFTWQNINLLLSGNQVSMSNGQEWWLAL